MKINWNKVLDYFLFIYGALWALTGFGSLLVINSLRTQSLTYKVISIVFALGGLIVYKIARKRY